MSSGGAALRILAAVERRLSGKVEGGGLVDGFCSPPWGLTCLLWLDLSGYISHSAPRQALLYLPLGPPDSYLLSLQSPPRRAHQASSFSGIALASMFLRAPAKLVFAV